MPRTVDPRTTKVLICAVFLVLIFAFTPISKALLSAFDGSFTPTSYSSLALQTPANATAGFTVGRPVLVRLTNATGHLETYHWNARQNGALISLGEETLANGKSATISVPSRGAAAGSLRIALGGTKVFVTVPLVRS